ncbi:MAG: hypothetical protein NTZ35_07735 [Ignavibacteriales bacterium]|nr:hypothetical protein [Ignavibacteriales bacterium]
MRTLRFFSYSFFYLCYCFSQSTAQWVQLGHDLRNHHIYAMTTSPNGTRGTNIFAGSSGGGVFLSTDNGTSWKLIGLKNLDVVSLAVSGTHVFAGTNGSGIFISDDKGKTWRKAEISLQRPNIFAFAVVPRSDGDAIVYAGTYYDGVYRSTDYGSHWVSTSEQKIPEEIWCLVSRDSIFYAGTMGLTYFSSDDGANWEVCKGVSDVHAFAVSPARDGGHDLFAGSIVGTGVWLSATGGWISVRSGLNNLYVWSLGISKDRNGKSIVFAGTEGGIYYSPSNGKKWTPANGGLTNLNIRSIAVSAKHVFVGTWGDGVWRRPLSDFGPVRRRTR